MNNSNPWVAPFLVSSSDSLIRSRALLLPEPIVGLEKLDPTQATFLIQKTLDVCFVPTENAVAVMRTILDLSIAQALQRFVSVDAYISKISSPTFSISPGPIYCLTGLAGVGKSSLLAAVRRLVTTQGSVQIPGHGSHPLVPYGIVELTSSWGEKEIVRQLGHTAYGAVNVERFLYGRGYTSVVIDETQFLAPGAQSHARIAKQIYLISRWGVLLIFSCNFSLVHKLEKRPHEERDRILSNPLVLTPDAPDSASWLSVLDAWQNILGRYLSFKLSNHAGEFWSLTGGLNRYGVRLLVIAYQLSRARNNKKIDWSDILAAYESMIFCRMRAEVIALFTASMGGKQPGRDLVCSFKSVKDAEYWENLRSRGVRKASSAIAELSLNVKQKAALKEYRKPDPSVTTKRTPSVRRTVESLTIAAHRFEKSKK